MVMVVTMTNLLVASGGENPSILGRVHILHQMTDFFFDLRHLLEMIIDQTLVTISVIMVIKTCFSSISQSISGCRNDDFNITSDSLRKSWTTRMPSLLK